MSTCLSLVELLSRRGEQRLESTVRSPATFAIRDEVSFYVESFARSLARSFHAGRPFPRSLAIASGNRLHILASGFFLALAGRSVCDFQTRVRRRHAHARALACVREPRRVTHSNKLATVLTTVQADICDGKLWTKGAREEREREDSRGERGRDATSSSSATSSSGESPHGTWARYTHVALRTILFTNYFIYPACSN